MKSLKQLVLFFLVFFITSYVNAACSGNVCSAVLVDKIYANISGKVYVATSGTETNLNCTPGSGVYLTLEIDEPGSYTIYALLLEAQKASKPIKLRIDDNSSGCTVKYAVYDR